MEDENLIRHTAAQILDEAGYRVLQAKTAGEALGLDAQLLTRVRLLVTDVVLPDRGGQELAVELVKWHPALKVVFISGYPEKAGVQRAIKGSYYLPKPFSGENLKGFVGRVLRGPKARPLARI